VPAISGAAKPHTKRDESNGSTKQRPVAAAATTMLSEDHDHDGGKDRQSCRSRLTFIAPMLVLGLTLRSRDGWIHAVGSGASS
jgi:hypothetical protein